MRDVLIIDIGHSYIKGFVFRQTHDAPQCVFTAQHRTPPFARQILESIDSLVASVYAAGLDLSHVMPLSWSDSVFWESDEGNLMYVPTEGSFGFHPRLPSFLLSGKPRDKALRGMGNQLLNLQESVDFVERTHRILPVSTFVAAHLANDREWRAWDITHASNSGMYGQEAQAWLPEMDIFFEANVINPLIVDSGVRVGASQNGLQVLVGGHDSPFICAQGRHTHYISAGTWVTASKPAVFAPAALKSTGSQRYLRTPLGTLLLQDCFEANMAVATKETAHRVMCHFDYCEQDSGAIPIVVFGGWAEKLWDALQHMYPWQSFELLEPLASDKKPSVALASEAAAYVFKVCAG